MANNYSNTVLFGVKLNLKDTTQIKIYDVIPIYPNRIGMSFIEVGANNGVDNDPIRDWVKKYHCKGVLVEPVKKAFKQLVSNYKGVEGVCFEQVAISSEDGETTIFVGKSTAASSLYPKHPPLRKSRPQQVRTMTLSTLVDKYKLNKLDLLYVDAEGHDFDVIASLDFDVCRPNIITYEHRHLDKKKSECETFLQNLSYKLFFNKNNTVAIDEQII